MDIRQRANLLSTGNKHIDEINQRINDMFNGGLFGVVLYIEDDDDGVIEYELSGEGLIVLKLLKTDIPMILNLNSEEEDILAKYLINCDCVRLIGDEGKTTLNGSKTKNMEINVFTSFDSYYKRYADGVPDKSIIILNTECINPNTKLYAYYEIYDLMYFDTEDRDDGVSYRFGLMNGLAKMENEYKLRFNGYLK